MCHMKETLLTHPVLVIDSLIEHRGKVAQIAPAHCHENTYNIHFGTVFGFDLTMGYTRHKDGNIADGVVHAWVAFGKVCREPWRKELATMSSSGVQQALAGASHWRRRCRVQRRTSSTRRCTRPWRAEGLLRQAVRSHGRVRTVQFR